MSLLIGSLLLASAVVGLSAVLLCVALRYIMVLNARKVSPPARSAAAKMMVVLGSGGHTAEMLSLVNRMDRQRYCPRVYVAAATDSMSLTKALTQEQAAYVADKAGRQVPVSTHSIPRSREVGQSYFTSVFTTLRALGACWTIVATERPDLVLVNGPGTCVPICVAAFIMRLMGVLCCRIVYVESIARVTTLSLSGKVLYASRLADLVLVQWPELQRRFPGTECHGRLM